MNYPVPSTRTITINANPSWEGAFKKARKVTPTLLLALSAIIALSSMMRPTNQALVPVINYEAQSQLYQELLLPEFSEAPIEFPEKAKYDIPIHPEKEEKMLAPASKKNRNRPISVKETPSEAVYAYIEKYSAIAVSEMHRSGVPASITLAQGIIESRSGRSSLAVSNKNHFGMKCTSKRCKKGHCTNHTDDTHKDFFKKYSSVEASFKDHSDLLNNHHYKKLHKLHRHGRDFRAWAYGLKAAGYATDKTYAEKLIGAIERYDLFKYDH